ncbi:MAG: S-layer homology domain-containing protein [Clostridia bacterium]|nr:S-layer homology domain-containing protein [Clostridia bacterium]
MTKKIVCALLIFGFILPVLCIPVSADSFPFTDISKSSWQYEPVKRAYELGLMNGVSRTKFDPNKRLTRAEAAMILYNLKSAGESYVRYSFKDVKQGSWYADAVEWMYRKGYTSGVTAERFGVNEYITRQDLVTMIYRMYEQEWGLNSKNSDIYVREGIVSSFKDSYKISPYAMPAMTLATGICMIITHNPTKHCNVPPIITGHNGVINPKGFCTRAEAAVIIANVYLIDTYI